MIKDRIINFKLLEIGNTEYGKGFAFFSFGTLCCYRKSLIGLWFDNYRNNKNNLIDSANVIYIDALFFHWQIKYNQSLSIPKIENKHA